MLLEMASEGLVIAQGTMPRFDAMYFVMLASRVLHILSAVVLVGGVFYLRMVIAPQVPAGEADGERWFGGRRGAWAMWVGMASLLLIVSGLWNYMQVIQQHERLASSYHMLLGLKMLLALVVFFFAALLAGKTALAQQARQKMKRWLTMCLALAIVVIMMAAVLRSYPRSLKPVEGPAFPTANATP